ncbi:MAG TPA: cellulase family glycosylhydrolase [Verrucomicrobiae bacterium]
MRFLFSSIFLACLVIGNFTSRAGSTSDTNFATQDFSAIRGANYCVAGGSHLEHWLNYDPKETARDLDYAKRININQIRVFLSYAAYTTNKEAFRKNLVDLARACQARGIGLMPVVSYKSEMFHESASYPLSRAWAKDLIDTLGNEPALAFWDVFNEPDYPPTSTNRPARIAYARVMAKIFRELDTRHPRTPVTIGFTYEKTMEENADVVDVLSFHDYSPTREEIRSNITAAVAFAAKVHKPVINTEIGCTGRANPYDVTIEEYSKAHVGFYVWELMVTKSWGNVHGIFYPDGTIRDPSIPAAMLGLFRNRTTNAVEEFPDREGWVTRTVANGRKWLNDTNAPYADGLRLAEIAANILEANELVPMRDPPTRRVELLREENPDPAALRELLAGLINQLEPYERKTEAP